MTPLNLPNSVLNSPDVSEPFQDLAQIGHLPEIDELPLNLSPYFLTLSVEKNNFGFFGGYPWGPKVVNVEPLQNGLTTMDMRMPSHLELGDSGFSLKFEAVPSQRLFIPREDEGQTYKVFSPIHFYGAFHYFNLHVTETTHHFLFETEALQKIFLDMKIGVENEARVVNHHPENLNPLKRSSWNRLIHWFGEVAKTPGDIIEKLKPLNDLDLREFSAQNDDVSFADAHLVVGSVGMTNGWDSRFDGRRRSFEYFVQSHFELGLSQMIVEGRPGISQTFATARGGLNLGIGIWVPRSESTLVMLGLTPVELQGFVGCDPDRPSVWGGVNLGAVSIQVVQGGKRK